MQVPDFSFVNSGIFVGGRGAPVEDKEFIFIAGVNRSGTSLLHEILRKHPQISGFTGTGVPEDEGQHLQSLLGSDLAFGGPGKFAFNDDCYMDESHPLATPENARVLFDQWSRYWDLSRKYLIEKSVANVVRSRFLQQLFPKSRFIFLMRHPLAVAYATRKWVSEIPIMSLTEHSIVACEKMLEDMKFLRSVFILKYEQLVRDPQEAIDRIFRHLGLESIKVTHAVRADVNEKYFLMWERERQKLPKDHSDNTRRKLEFRANQLGYGIGDYEDLIPVSWLGAHGETAA